MMLTKRDNDLLNGLSSYGLFSTKQVIELYFRGTNSAIVLRRLRILEHGHKLVSLRLLLERLGLVNSWTAEHRPLNWSLILKIKISTKRLSMAIKERMGFMRFGIDSTYLIKNYFDPKVSELLGSQLTAQVVSTPCINLNSKKLNLSSEIHTRCALVDDFRTEILNFLK